MSGPVIAYELPELVLVIIVKVSCDTGGRIDWLLEVAVMVIE